MSKEIIKSAGDCGLMRLLELSSTISYREQVTFLWNDGDVRFSTRQTYLLDFSACSQASVNYKW